MQSLTSHRQPIEPPGDQLRSLKASLLRRLGADLEGGRWRRQRLFTATYPVPALDLDAVSGGEQWFVWEQPERRHARIGLGCAMRVTAEGEERLSRLATLFSEATESWGEHDPEDSQVTPGGFLCFGFTGGEKMGGVWQGLPSAAIFIPELLYRRDGGHCTLSFTVEAREDLSAEEVLAQWSRQLEHLFELELSGRASLEKGPAPTRLYSHPSDDEWMELVELATSEIRSGRIDKLVPARSIGVTQGRPFAPDRLLSGLRRLQPRSRLFALRLGGKVFAAASPERLVLKQGRSLVCDAVGGTAARDSRASADSRLGQALLRDSKSIHEHLVVVREIRDKLSPMCSGLSHAATPVLMGLRNLQHLWTQFHGTLASERSLVEVAEALHPTAAVNGFPAENATRWLDRNESLPRGWFTGAGGWMDRDGDGELAVLLRCALIEGRHAVLFAGAGVTAQSDPAAELLETELKLGTMLEALSYA